MARFVDPNDGGNVLGEGLAVLGPTGARKISLYSRPAFRHLYVTTTGDDAVNPGTQAAPFRTVQRAVDELGPRGHGTVHCASGTYDVRLLGINGTVCIKGDGAGVVGDDGLTEVVAPQVSAAGTGAAVAVGSGFAADEHRGRFVVFTDGAAIGQRRAIASNTTTDIIPAANFNPAPSPGDSFRIYDPAVVLTFDMNAFAERCGSRKQDGSSPSPDPINPGDALGGLYLVDVEIDAVSASSHCVIVDSAVHCYAVKSGDNITRWRLVNAELYSGSDTTSTGEHHQLAAVLGIDSRLYSGAGLSLYGAQMRVLKAFAFGYWVGDDDFTVTDGRFAMQGGELRDRVQCLTGGVFEMSTIATPVSKLAVSGVALQLLQLSSHALIGSNCTIEGTTAGVDTSEGCAVRLSTNNVAISASAGIAVKADHGGRVYVAGNPSGQWSGSVADCSVTGATAASSAFPNSGDTLAAASGDGSLITRVS